MVHHSMIWLRRGVVLAALLLATAEAQAQATAERTNITCGPGLTCSPNPITGTGVISGGNGVTILNTTTAHGVTVNEWNSGWTFVATVSGAGITLPLASTLLPNGGVTLAVQSGTMIVTPNPGDTINGGTAGVAIIRPVGLTAVLTTNLALTGFLMPTGEAQILPLSWAPGQNLAGGTGAIPLFSVGTTPITVLTVSCRVEAQVSGTANIDVRYANATTALTGGTSLITAPCNAAGTAPSITPLTLTLAGGVVVPAGSALGIVASGAGWASSTGAGSIQFAFQQ